MRNMFGFRVFLFIQTIFALFYSLIFCLHFNTCSLYFIFKECRIEDPNMREKSCDKINDRNWLLKRKRKRLPCNSDVSTGKKNISPESSRSNSSTKQRIKEGTRISQSERKLRGHDGVNLYFAFKLTVSVIINCAVLLFFV